MMLGKQPIGAGIKGDTGAQGAAGAAGAAGANGQDAETKLSPVVTLGAISENLEWIGDVTFDFTTYDECNFIMRYNGINAMYLMDLTLDGVVTGYEWQQNIRANAGNAVTEGNADTKITFNGALTMGTATDFIYYGKIWKHQDGTLYFHVWAISSEGIIDMSGKSTATKLDKFKFKNYRSGFAFPDAGSRYFDVGSSLTVWGAKKL